MRLLVFPGAGNPGHPKYERVYGLIERLATKAGYIAVDLSTRWPGHFRPPDKAEGMLNLPNAANEAVKILARYETAGEPYLVLGRSFGSFVALRALQNIRTRQLQQVMLWGPPTMWMNWNCFVQRIDEFLAKGLERWVNLDPNYYTTIEPMECLLRAVTVPTRVASGELDAFCSPRDLAYYRELTKENRFVHVEPEVKGAEHEVTDDAPLSVVADYGGALFGTKTQ